MIFKYLLKYSHNKFAAFYLNQFLFLLNFLNYLNFYLNPPDLLSLFLLGPNLIVFNYLFLNTFPFYLKIYYFYFLKP